MIDIAVRAHVSQSTVSRVLSGAPTTVAIAQETRDRIQEAARELNYRPNPLARALRGAKTMLLGAIVRDITDPFFADAIEALSIQARARGYNLVLGSAHAHGDEAIELAEVLESRHCDGILILGDMHDRPEIIDDLRDDEIPVVALWHGSRHADIASIDVDNGAGVSAIVEHLVGLGHRRIAFVGAGPLGDIRRRAAGFEDALRRHHIDPRQDLVIAASNAPADGAAALRILTSRTDPPTAVVAATDVLAVGILHAAAELGLDVPLDLSVTGFDDIRLAAYMVPALTTVHMPINEIVAASLQVLLDTPRGATVERRVLQPTLVIRASSGPALV